MLAKLEDDSVAGQHPDFAEHVFAISAVSGGSLGSAAFDAALAGPHGREIRTDLSKMLGEDFLAPPLAALLYPDFLQRFLPVPCPALDRGQWLERAWEQAAHDHLHNDYFARNFNDLWAARDPAAGYLPALFLNGTSVESGQRLIASNVRVDGRFLDAIDAGRKVAAEPENCDLPLSTAAHNSARFTYVSPAGRFGDGTHVVDGGYFENSGATTALEILRAVKKSSPPVRSPTCIPTSSTSARIRSPGRRADATSCAGPVRRPASSTTTGPGRSWKTRWPPCGS